MRPVLVSQRVDVIERYGERRDALDQRWTSLLASVGLWPIPVPNDADAAGRAIELPGLAGVILSGGESPGAYGGAAPERDAAEKVLLQRSIDSKLPLLGVCRGLQIIFEHFGVRMETIQGHVAKDHGLAITGTSELANLLRASPQVNSFHTLAARQVSGPLRVVATAPDETVEAVEHESLPLSGVMWHPERFEPQRPVDRSILRHALRLDT